MDIKLEKTLETSRGVIHYWTNDICASRKSLVFLPGLTAAQRRQSTGGN